jgi:hypothetical protein
MIARRVFTSLESHRRIWRDTQIRPLTTPPFVVVNRCEADSNEKVFEWKNYEVIYVPEVDVPEVLILELPPLGILNCREQGEHRLEAANHKEGRDPE